MSKKKHPQITFTMNRMLKEDVDYILSKEGNNQTLESLINEMLGDYVDEYFKLNEDSKVHMTKCPKCGKIVRKRTLIEKEFGWRMNDGKNIPQSHCRECREKELKLNKQDDKTVENQKLKLPEEGDIVWEIHEQTDNFDDTSHLIASQMYYTSGYSYRLGQDIFLTQEEANEKIQEIYKRVGYK